MFVVRGHEWELMTQARCSNPQVVGPDELACRSQMSCERSVLQSYAFIDWQNVEAGAEHFESRMSWVVKTLYEFS